MIRQTRKLNLIPNNQVIVIPVSQYDTGNDRLIFELFLDGEPYTPTGTAVIQGISGGDRFMHEVKLNGNIATSDLFSDMTSKCGQAYTQLVIYEGDDRTGSQGFYLSVQKDAEGTI